jgi:hypothetical protein
MPCRDGGPLSVDEDDLKSARSELRAVKKRLDLATRVACEIEKHLAAADWVHLSSEAQAWIKEHREADAKRKKAEEEQERRDREEAARRLKLEKDQTAALNKLTHEERRVLGLPDPA